ncbi:MAG: glycosyltransferase, partial [Shewanella sp.]
MWPDSFYVLDQLVLSLVRNQELWLLLFPMMIVIELPLYLLVLTGIFRWAYHPEQDKLVRYPSISFVITCYGEGEAIEITIDTLAEQLYPGQIEILAVVDGAKQNADTYQAAMKGMRKHQGKINRI